MGVTRCTRVSHPYFTQELHFLRKACRCVADPAVSAILREYADGEHSVACQYEHECVGRNRRETAIFPQESKHHKYYTSVEEKFRRRGKPHLICPPSSVLLELDLVYGQG